MFASLACCFSIWYFLECCLLRVQMYVLLSSSFEFFLFFFQIFLSIQQKEFLFPYLTPFFCIWLGVCLCAFSTDLLEEFNFLILECPILLVLLDSIQLSFESPLFRQYLLIFLFKLNSQTSGVLFGSFQLQKMSSSRVLKNLFLGTIRNIFNVFVCTSLVHTKSSNHFRKLSS